MRGTSALMVVEAILLIHRDVARYTQSLKKNGVQRDEQLNVVAQICPNAKS